MMSFCVLNLNTFLVEQRKTAIIQINFFVRILKLNFRFFVVELMDVVNLLSTIHYDGNSEKCFNDLQNVIS